ncbi:MAG TPA: sigma factor-like helix-turn-helix DNA-binding protein [Mycobacteriales bacterium]
MRERQEFAEFAAVRSGPLRRQAYLLTGSVPRADRVVERALADTGRRWTKLGSTAAAEAHARRLVASGAVRSRGAVPAVASTSLGTALPTDDTGEAVWRALAGLPPRRRAVLVLRYDEGLSDAEVADRLGLPAATVTAEGEAGLATLRGLLRRRGAPEDLLPTTLATRATDLPTPAPGAAADLPAPADGAAASGRGEQAAGAAAAGLAATPAPETGRSGGAETDRPGGAVTGRPGGAGGGRSGGAGAARLPVGAVAAGREWRRWGLVGGGVLAVLAVVAAVVVPGLRDDRVAAAPGPVPARQASAPGQLPWAGRGPLAGDDGLLRDALRAWQDGVPARQRPGAAAVLYAGTPDGARTVLLQGTDGTGQSWVAQVTDTGGTPVLRTTEPLGRAVPLLALPGGDRTRLLAPPDPGTTLLADEAGTIRPLTMDADGLSEPVTAPADGLPVVVTARGPVVAGSGRVLPGRLSAVTGTVDLAPATLGLGPSAITAIWYDDGALVARRLGGAVSVAGLGPVRRTTLRAPGRPRKVEARAYEAVRAGTRYLATVVRVDGAPACVATADAGPAGTTLARPPVLVSRCLPARAAEGVVVAVGGGGVRSVRVRLPGPAPAPGKPAGVVTVTVGGASGAGLVGLARVPGRPVAAAPAEARNARGAVVARVTLPEYRGPQL